MSKAMTLLLILLSNVLDSKAMYTLNRKLIDLLQEQARKTDTNIDDKIVEIVENFLKANPNNPNV